MSVLTNDFFKLQKLVTAIYIFLLLLLVSIKCFPLASVTNVSPILCADIFHLSAS